jgi:hypothetical protein
MLVQGRNNLKIADVVTAGINTGPLGGPDIQPSNGRARCSTRMHITAVAG